MTDPGMRMARLRRFLVLILFVSPMTSASVEAQSDSTPTVVTPSDVTPSDITPSDGLSSWPTAGQDQPGVVSAGQRTGTKKSVNAGAGTQQATQLCFLPGIGWQSVAVPTVGDTDTQRLTSSTAHSRRAATAQGSDGCSELSANSAVSGVSRGGQKEAAASLGLNAPAPGMNGFTVNDASSPPGQSTYERSLLGISSMSAGLAKESAKRAIPSSREMQGLNSMLSASGVFGAQPKGIKNKAYTSTFELRRRIWNAPDLETRFALERQLESSDRARHRSSYSSEALNSTADRFSFRSNGETPKSRVDRRVGGARTSGSTRRRIGESNWRRSRSTTLGTRRASED